MSSSEENNNSMMAARFRGYLPVVIDIETGGFNCATDAMLEIAATFLDMNEIGELQIHDTLNFHVEPFGGANLDPAALAFTGIDPYHPLRPSQPENDVLRTLFKSVRQEVSKHECKRAIVVAHNAQFDQGFLNAAADRCQIKRNPFHPFSSFDTATLAGLAYGQTVLAKACYQAGIAFDSNDAHSAHYDSLKTAELFCGIVNKWKSLGGWTD
ncbi:ribonuclease T [bacterium]|nr:ribonuclease T [bacterium]